jgi:hypothetical protein
MRMVFKVLSSLLGLLIGEIVLGYILSLPQVVDAIVRVQTFNSFLIAVPLRLVIIVSSVVIVGLLIIRMVLNERRVIEDLRYSLYESMETLENYKRINEQYPSQVSEADIERIKLRIKKIHQEMKSREINVRVNDSRTNINE